MNTGDFHGSVFVLALYDVCEEISLSELRPLIGGRLLTPSFKHTTPGYVRFERPPVVESLEPVALESGEQFTGTLQYYDYGVVGVLLRLHYSGSWTDLKKVASRWVSSLVFEDLTTQIVRKRLETAHAALCKIYDNWLSEDYYIFQMDPCDLNANDLLRERGEDISQLINGEILPLSPTQTAETLQGSMSYYPNDLTVVGWNAAFVYDAEAAADPTIRIFEYANSQLLQFRHYDELLTRELAEGYRFLESRRGLLAGWRMRPGATRLRTVLLEITELTERTNNALKFVGDMFSARLYKLCASKIGVSEYQALVQDKLRTADDLYDFMIERFHQARGFLLESVVVVILMIELFFLFSGKR